MPTTTTETENVTSPIFYELPCWEESGHRVSNRLNVEAALNEANANWRAEKSDIFIETAQAGVMASIGGIYAVVRKDKHLALGVVKNQYTPLQNADAFFALEALVLEGFCKISLVGQIYEGKRVWVMATLPLINVASQEFAPVILLSNGHDGETHRAMNVMFLEMVNNSMLPIRDGSLLPKVRHTSAAGSGGYTPEKIRKLTTEAVEDFKSAMHKMTGSGSKMSEASRRSFFRAAYNRRGNASDWKALSSIEKVHDALSLVPSVKGTAYSAYLAVCKFEDYRKYHADPNDRRTNQVLFGYGNRAKVAAFKLAKSRK